jgi:hypothetical protein
MHVPPVLLSGMGPVSGRPPLSMGGTPLSGTMPPSPPPADGLGQPNGLAPFEQ